MESSGISSIFSLGLNHGAEAKEKGEGNGLGGEKLDGAGQQRSLCAQTLLEIHGAGSGLEYQCPA